MSVSRFYQIEQEVLLLEAEKVSLFTSHNPSIGSYRESILKDFVRKFIPKSLQVKSGFIAGNNNQNKISDDQSRQIDILIYDNDNYTALLETNDFSVVRPEAVLGCVEVKSTLTFYKKYSPNKSNLTNADYPLGGGRNPAYRWDGTLIDALKNIKAAAQVCRTKDTTYYSGVLAYTANFDPIKLYRALDNEELQEQLDLKHLNELPMNICVVGKFIVSFSHMEMFKEKGSPEYEVYHDKYESYYNEISVSGDDFQYPLQFFSVHAHNQISFLHSGKAGDNVGLFSAIGASVKFRVEHFRLLSDGR
ncbi:hypothetical protein BIY21_04665 [Vibrio ponticus]|uniref:DUF6602 domain-containing protein n=1 Tax=Vibrio ponticus TaxID=265668 RepID=A0ABX3FAC1_9VIBR|nr:DUF6602 domain-containing protein [Vibrio ponticus]OLQ85535.1 hypothetical protein BIY21_04665 [Vibrio ponticus]